MNRPTLEAELALLQQGYRFIAGIDEAGRGAWAGPVVAGAVILSLSCPKMAQILDGVRDSKQLTPRQRQTQYDVICQSAADLGIGVATPAEIDGIGIAPATRLAMQRAVAHLSLPPDHLIIDYMRLADLTTPQLVEIKADGHHLSVAAASIVAKVFRDRLMVKYEERYPGYGFAAHKGYGTAAHRAALTLLGPTPIHRMSFAPMRALALPD
jgi:ribonuclease HII